MAERASFHTVVNTTIFLVHTLFSLSIVSSFVVHAEDPEPGVAAGVAEVIFIPYSGQYNHILGAYFLGRIGLVVWSTLKSLILGWLQV